MSPVDRQTNFYRAHMAWGQGNLEEYLSFLTDDVIHTVNIEGQDLPYAIDAAGKNALRARLSLLLDIFEIQAFVIESVVQEQDCSRSWVLGYYKHRKTGERLEMKMRFRAWEKDGLFYRVEEYYDAAYLEAFERFVRHLQAASEARAD